MNFSKFMQEREKGFPAAAYLLHGSDTFFLKEAERLIREATDREQRDFAVDTYDASEVSGAELMREVMDSLNTFSFFGGKKSVILLNVQKLKKAELTMVEHYLESPSTSATLFLFFSGKPNKTAEKALRKCTVIFTDPGERELKKWLVARARDEGVEFSSDVIDYMTGLFGGEAGILSSEISKLALTGKSRIAMEDIEGLVSGEADLNTFELTRAVTSGNRKKAFSLSPHARHADPQMLIGALNWQVARLKGKIPRERLVHYFRVLLQADIINKSTGTTYPLELIISKLLCR